MSVANIQTKHGTESQLCKMLVQQDTGGLDGDHVQLKYYAEEWLKQKQPSEGRTYVPYIGQVRHYLLNYDYVKTGYGLTRIARTHISDLTRTEWCVG